MLIYYFNFIHILSTNCKEKPQHETYLKFHKAMICSTIMRMLATHKLSLINGTVSSRIIHIADETKYRQMKNIHCHK